MRFPLLLFLIYFKEQPTNTLNNILLTTEKWDLAVFRWQKLQDYTRSYKWIGMRIDKILTIPIPCRFLLIDSLSISYRFSLLLCKDFPAVAWKTPQKPAFWRVGNFIGYTKRQSSEKSVAIASVFTWQKIGRHCTSMRSLVGYCRLWTGHASSYWVKWAANLKLRVQPPF